MEPEGSSRIQKSPPPVPIPSQLNPVYTPPIPFLKIHFTLRVPKLMSLFRSWGRTKESVHVRGCFVRFVTW
jgi:hypothetical protein